MFLQPLLHLHTEESHDPSVTAAGPAQRSLIYLALANGSHDARRHQEDEDDEKADEELMENKCLIGTESIWWPVELH